MFTTGLFRGLGACPRFAALALAAALILSALPASPSTQPRAATAATPSQWAMYGHDAAHTGFNSDETVLKPPLIEKWRATWTRGHDNRFPVVADGLIYVMGGDGISALDTQTGAIRWTVPGFQNEELATANGVLYTVAGAASALDAQTGALLWSTRDCPVTISGVRPAVSDGLLYVGAGASPSEPPQTNKLCAIDAQTGALRWSYVVSNQIASTPAVAGGVVYFTTMNDTLYALNAQAGALRWSMSGGGSDSVNSPALANDIVYFHSSGGAFYALDSQTGSILWTRPMPVGGGPPGLTPAIAQGIVYHPDGYAWDAQTGAVKWTNSAPCCSTAPVIANGAVYLNMVALDAQTGTVVWQYKPSDGLPLGSAVVAEGNLYMSLSYNTRDSQGTIVVAFQNVKDSLFLPLITR